MQINKLYFNIIGKMQNKCNINAYTQDNIDLQRIEL